MTKIAIFTSMFLVSVLGFSCSTPLPLSAQTEGQVQHDNHPCGHPDLSLDNLRMFFHGKWQARSAELHGLAREEWIRFHKIQDLGITKVLVFQSPMHRTYAVVSAKPIDDIMCVVKIKAQIALAYTPDKLHAILSKETMESDI